MNNIDSRKDSSENITRIIRHLSKKDRLQPYLENQLKNKSKMTNFHFNAYCNRAVQSIVRG